MHSKQWGLGDEHISLDYQALFTGLAPGALAIKFVADSRVRFLAGGRAAGKLARSRAAARPVSSLM